jgi:hypothetical protein
VGSLAEHRREAFGLGADPLLDQLAPVSQHTNLTFLLVDVDANMVHGWPLLSAALTACQLLWGSICHHVEREASRFIPSILLTVTWQVPPLEKLNIRAARL